MNKAFKYTYIAISVLLLGFFVSLFIARGIVVNSANFNEFHISRTMRVQYEGDDEESGKKYIEAEGVVPGFSTSQSFVFGYYTKNNKKIEDPNLEYSFASTPSQSYIYYLTDEESASYKTDIYEAVYYTKMSFRFEIKVLSEDKTLPVVREEFDLYSFGVGLYSDGFFTYKDFATNVNDLPIYYTHVNEDGSLVKYSYKLFMDSSLEKPLNTLGDFFYNNIKNYVIHLVVTVQ